MRMMRQSAMCIRRRRPVPSMPVPISAVVGGSVALVEERNGIADVNVIYETDTSTQAVGMRLRLIG